MDLRDWIVAEHDAALSRFEQSVVATVPTDRWLDPAGEHGSSIAWLAFHTALHEDVAVNAVLAGGTPVIESWRPRLGLVGFPGHVGLGEAEVRDLTATLAVDELVPYVRAVHDSAARWLARIEPDDLDSVPPSSHGLAANGVGESEVPWLYSMWAGKPAAWFVQWEAIGHRVNHVGEMVSVRNRLGLSPF